MLAEAKWAAGWIYQQQSWRERLRATRKVGDKVRESDMSGAGKGSKRACSFVEHGDLILCYKRYAALYFIVGIDKGDNELIALQLIQMYVEVLDKYFGSVCELDLVYDFHKAHHILDEILLNGEMQESRKAVVLTATFQQDEIP